MARQLHSENLIPLKKGETANRRGGPKKALTILTDYVKREYGVVPNKGEIRDMMNYIESLPVKQLRKFIKDPLIPACVAAYGELILTGRPAAMRKVQGSEMLNDRINGKLVQPILIDTEPKINIIAPVIHI